MQEQNLVRHQTTEPPIVIKTTGLSVEAKEMLDAIARRENRRTYQKATQNQ
jgi:hypothetical protein